MDTTFDALLNRRVQLEQPAQGFRVAIDTVLLAAAVPAKAGDNVLDLGAGAGGALLCLACRVPQIFIVGIEIQPALAELCLRNIELNSFDAKLEIVKGGAAQLPLHFAEAFDHVMMNPPYHEEAQHDVSPNTIKRIANTEKDGDLEKWILSATRALKPQGVLTLIHRADRLDEILGLVSQKFGEIKVLSIQSKEDKPAGRFILQAKKGGQLSVTKCKNLVMHQAGGGYSEAAESILRHLKSIDFIE